MVASCSVRVIAAVGAVVIGVAVLDGCSPLPGSTIDPVYMKFPRPGVDSSPPAEPTPSPAPVSSPPVTPPRTVAADSGTTTWTGRYRDSRGSGDIELSLVQRGASISGVWKLRTGGGGTFHGTVGSEGRIAFRMETASGECPGTLEGWADVNDSGLVAAYHGRDCQGPVSDGRLDATRK